MRNSNQNSGDMKKQAAFFVASFLIATSLFAQTDTSVSTFWRPKPRNYQVKQALEVESLVPMFLFGGYHFAAGYRYRKFRVRVSVINGGTYNAETVGINNSSPAFKRFYNTSPGIFFGYNAWKNLELYTYLESHTFGIEQENSGIRKDIRSIDTGLGVSYQFFVGRYFYVQSGLHLYLRRNNSADFNGVQYNISNADVSPVIRIGARLWRKY
ncbi:MAG: hypothetical protein LH609_02890 [Rudanella sp.]|nr:hypothetical protein [Rudanella sp.]